MSSVAKKDESQPINHMEETMSSVAKNTDESQPINRMEETMSSVAKQINVICKAHLDAMQQFAALAREGAQNFLKLPAQAAREFASKDDGQPWFGTNVAGVFSNWSRLYQDQTQKVLDMTLAYWENTSLEQRELARLVQEEAAAASTSFLGGWQAGTNVADAAVRQSAERMEHRTKVGKLAA